MGLMDRIRGWFKSEREHEIEDAEELRRDPHLREYEEQHADRAEQGLIGESLPPRPGELEER